MSIKNLLAEHNELAATPLANWTGSESDLEKRVQRLRKTSSKVGAAKAKVEEPAAKEKKPKIGDLISEQLNAGNIDVEDILAKVKKAFPDSNTGINSVRWYAAQLKISLKKEKSAKAEKPAKAPAAVKTTTTAKTPTTPSKTVNKIPVKLPAAKAPAKAPAKIKSK